MRIVSWNVARLSARLAEQAAALAGRDPDVVALQEITRRTLPLWRAALSTIGLTHIRASLDDADPGRQPIGRRRTGVLLSSRAPLTSASTRLPVPWPETTLAAATSSVATGEIEVHCVHVPNAANGWVKVRTLKAIRSGLATGPPGPRVLCGDLNIPRRELPSGEVISSHATPEAASAPIAGPNGTRLSWASFRGFVKSATRMPFEPCMATRARSRVGHGGG